MPRAAYYDRYGGRGIRICDRWMKFENFVADMGIPEAHETLDRIDPNGNYEPANCRWTTWEVQHSNRANCIKLTLGGRTMTQAAWARELGLSAATIAHRRKLGLPIEKVLAPKAA